MHAKLKNTQRANCNFVTLSEEIPCPQLPWEAPCACCSRPSEVTTFRIYGRIRHHHLWLGWKFSNPSSEIGNDDISLELQPAALPSVLRRVMLAQAMRSSWRSLWMSCCGCQLFGKQEPTAVGLLHEEHMCPGCPPDFFSVRTHPKAISGNSPPDPDSRACVPELSHLCHLLARSGQFHLFFFWDAAVEKAGWV